MTVAELREALAGLPDDLVVLDEYDGMWAEAGLFTVTLHREPGTRYIDTYETDKSVPFRAAVVSRVKGTDYSPVEDDWHAQMGKKS